MQLNTALHVVKIKYNISFSNYRLLAEWLNCYEYIQPSNRVEPSQQLVDVIYYISTANTKISPVARLKTAYWQIENISSNLNLMAQIVLLKELKRILNEQSTRTGID